MHALLLLFSRTGTLQLGSAGGLDRESLGVALLGRRRGAAASIAGNVAIFATGCQALLLLCRRALGGLLALCFLLVLVAGHFRRNAAFHAFATKPLVCKYTTSAKLQRVTASTAAFACVQTKQHCLV